MFWLTRVPELLVVQMAPWTAAKLIALQSSTTRRRILVFRPIRKPRLKVGQSSRKNSGLRTNNEQFQYKFALRCGPSTWAEKLRFPAAHMQQKLAPMYCQI